MERLRVLGPTADGEGLVLVDDEDGARFEVSLDDLRPVIGAATREADRLQDLPEHHVRVVPPAEAAGSRRVGGLAPGAFLRATSSPPARPDGVRALIGEAGALSALPEPSPAAPVPPASPGEPKLVRTSSPRLGAGAIQGLLRAGRPISEVAEVAGAPEDWVAKLDETVERERTVLVGQMLRERAERPEGASSMNLGDSIVANLAARGVSERALEKGWSAARVESGPWRVRFTYTQGGLQRQAEWSYDPKTGRLEALDEAASRLGWVPPETGQASLRA